MTDTEQNLTKGQRTARKILEAAALCISQKGIEKTSVTNIAKLANLKRSLVAYHFPRKAEIIYHVVNLIVENLVESVSTSVEEKSGREGLKSVYASYLHFFHDHPHYFHVMLHFYYMASIDTKAKQLHTNNVTRSMNRLIHFLTQTLQTEAGKSTSEQTLRQYAWALHTWIIGTIMTGQCTIHDKSAEDYQKECLMLFEREVDLIVNSHK